MYGNRGHADFLKEPSELGSGELGFIPAQPHFYADGNFHGFDDALHQIDRFIRLAHQAGSRAGFGDAVDGAAHVDVDGMDAPRFQQLGRLAHGPDFASENLHGEGRILRAGLHQLPGFLAAFQKRTRIDQIGRRHSHPAQFADNPAKRQICVPRQGRQQKPRSQFERAVGKRRLRNWGRICGHIMKGKGGEAQRGQVISSIILAL